MSTTLSTSVDTSTHPPQQVAQGTSISRPGRHRVRLTHRIALHVGLALITWSRRPSSAVPSHEYLAQREARELQAERLRHLITPVR